jgi:hypothetical protein
MMGERIVELTAPSRQLWADFRAAINLAAAQFTGKPELPLSPFYAHDLSDAR